MSEPEVVHHVDYRSKAEDRRRELEKLQRKGLAKTKASQLRDASAPVEACNFLQKQRELFATRRKNQVEAMEFLHQYRAEDDPVLRTPAARHSIRSNSYKYSARHNVTSRWSLSPAKLRLKQQPDARASVYSYAVYPLCISKDHDGIIQHNGTLGDSCTMTPTQNHSENDSEPIHFESAFGSLSVIAKEASMFPLPDDDGENEFHQGPGDLANEASIRPLPENDDGVGLVSSFNTVAKEVLMLPLLEKEDINDDSMSSVDETNEQTIPLIIVDESSRKQMKSNSTDDLHCRSPDDAAKEAQFPTDDCDSGVDSNIGSHTGEDELDVTKDHSILILDGENCSDQNEEENNPLFTSEKNPLGNELSDPKTKFKAGMDLPTQQFIPFEAFSKLGESLVLGSISGTKSTDHDEVEIVTADSKVESDDDSIIPGEFFMQLGASMMANDLLSSKDEEAVEKIPTTSQFQNSMEKSDTMTTTATASTEASQISTASKSVSGDYENIRQSNNEIGDEESNYNIGNIWNDDTSKRDSTIDEGLIDPIPEFNEKLDVQFECTKISFPEANTPTSLKEDTGNVESDSEEGNLGTQIGHITVPSVDVGAAFENGESEYTRTPKKANLTTKRSDDSDPNTIDVVTTSNVISHERETLSTMDKNDDGKPPEQNTAPSRSNRHRRQKKKKDKSYYPSSSLFVSRQFFSR